MIVWIDGALVEEDEARISPFDHGLLTGDGVFETLRAYNGVPFAWTRHIDRLKGSAEAMELVLREPSEMRAAADAALLANGLSDARIRITVTGGPHPPGSGRGDGPPLTLVTATPLDPVERTIDVVVVPWTRNERGALAGVKSTSYGENVRALAYARGRAAGEAIFANGAGHLCEGTGTNVFLVQAGTVLTPPLSAGCLAGVTRALVLELCAAEGLPAEEADHPPEALGASDEAFLTSSTREVQPIARVDGVPLPAGPGPFTRRLAAAFSSLVARVPDP